MIDSENARCLALLARRADFPLDPKTAQECRRNSANALAWFTHFGLPGASVRQLRFPTIWADEKTAAEAIANILARRIARSAMAGEMACYYDLLFPPRIESPRKRVLLRWALCVLQSLGYRASSGAVFLGQVRIYMFWDAIEDGREAGGRNDA